MKREPDNNRCVSDNGTIVSFEKLEHVKVIKGGVETQIPCSSELKRLGLFGKGDMAFFLNLTLPNDLARSELKSLRKILSASVKCFYSGHSKFFISGSRAHKAFTKSVDVLKYEREQDVKAYAEERGEIGGFHLINRRSATNGSVTIETRGQYELTYKKENAVLKLRRIGEIVREVLYVNFVDIDETVAWESTAGSWVISNKELAVVKAHIQSFMSLIESQVIFRETNKTFLSKFEVAQGTLIQ